MQREIKFRGLTAWDKDTAELKWEIAIDYLTDLESAMDAKGISRDDLAKILNVPERLINEQFGNPSNPCIYSMIRMARAIGLKISIVTYDDGDAENEKGPIIANIFKECWEKAGKPKNGWDMARSK